MAKNYVSLSKLSTFLDNLKNTFSILGHKHTLSDITDYTVDSELSSTSSNPVQNKVINEEFDAISEALQVYDLALDDKSDVNHNHDEDYDTIGSAETALATSKEYTDAKLASMIFIGTYAEYQTANANGQIPINTFVILTDDETSGGGSSGGESSSTSTSSLLGTGALGYMILA